MTGVPTGNTPRAGVLPAETVTHRSALPAPKTYLRGHSNRRLRRAIPILRRTVPARIRRSPAVEQQFRQIEQVKQFDVFDLRHRSHAPATGLNSARSACCGSCMPSRLAGIAGHGVEAFLVSGSLAIRHNSPITASGSRGHSASLTRCSTKHLDRRRNVRGATARSATDEHR